MALQLFVKLQTPTIELKIEAKDGAGVKDSFYAGFKRYPLEEAKKKLEDFQELYTNYSDDTDELSKRLIAILKEEIQYIREIKVTVQDTENGKNKEIHIPDTRTAKPVETLWDSPEECLAALLDALLDCGPMRVSLNSALTKAWLNTDFDEDKLKN